MKNKNGSGVDMYSESKYSYNEDGDMQKNVIWHDDNGMHSETTIIQKKVPAAGTIILTAVVFLLIGALIAGMIFFARFVGIRSIADVLRGNSEQQQEQPTPPVENTTPTPAPQTTPSGNNSGETGTFANNIPEIYKNNVNGVVIVQSYDGKARLSNLVGTGTGFCIAENGYILTNAHVVEDANTYQVVTYDGKTVDASLVGKDVRTDIAVLKIKDISLKVLETGDSSAVQTGDFVFAIGHPTGDELSFTATFGMVGAVNRSVIIDGVRNSFIQIDAAINPGNSGGPLFDMNGRVIGVNSAKTVIASYDEDGEPISAEGLGFAIPINTALDTARAIIANGSIVRPGIGISTIVINEETAAKYDIPVGALVYSILEDGPGHLAGLHVDDIIIKADDTDIPDSESLGKYISSKSVGDVVKLTVFRDGETLTLDITIGDLNQLGSTVLNDEYGGEKYGLR